MKVLAVVLSALTLAFASTNAVKTDAKNDTLLEEGKIVGGLATDISDSPSQVAILDGLNLACMGSIIDPKVVLTAAHCLVYKNIPTLKIRSGSNFYALHGHLVDVIKAKIHPYFTSRRGSINFDIGILFLAESAIALGIPAKIIALWDIDTAFSPGTLATLSGWGVTAEGSTVLSPILRSVSLPVLSLEDCAAHWGPVVAISNICAGYSFGGRDGCQGDSGAGLVIGDRLAGVSAFGLGCGRPLIPSGFASVPAFRHWIWANTGV